MRNIPIILFFSLLIILQISYSNATLTDRADDILVYNSRTEETLIDRIDSLRANGTLIDSLKKAYYEQQQYLHSEKDLAFHSLPSPAKHDHDPDFRPIYMLPLYFNVYDSTKNKHYKVEGYVADLYARVRTFPFYMLWPEKFDYMFTLSNKFIKEKKNHLYTSFIYTLEPEQGKCPNKWELVTIASIRERCMPSHIIPMVYVDNNIRADGTAKCAWSSKSIKTGSFFQKCVQTIDLPLVYTESLENSKHEKIAFVDKEKKNKLMYEKGCDKSVSEAIHSDENEKVLCFRYFDKKRNISYKVVKSRFEEGNYLQFRLDSETETTCPKNWIFFQGNCLYKIPDPKF